MNLLAKIAYSVILLGLVGCQATLNMPTNYAVLSAGQVNSGHHPLGRLFLWDLEKNTLTRLTEITSIDVPVFEETGRPTLREGDFVDSDYTSVGKSTEIQFSGSDRAEAFRVQAEAVFISKSEVKLDNFKTMYFADPRYMLNAPEMRTWREQLNPELAQQRYRFVYISGVVQAEKLEIALEDGVSSSADANVVEIGGIKYTFKYSKKSSDVKKSSSGAPLLVESQVFYFTRKMGPDGIMDLRFYYDTTNVFTFQKVL